MGLIAFFIGRMPIYWYGCTAAIAVVVAFVIGWIEFKINDENTLTLWDIFLWSLPCCFIGARLFHVIRNHSVYLAAPGQIFAFSNGGFSQYGAVMGLLVAIFLYSSIYKQPIWHLLDLLIVPAIAALAVMQFGHFFMQLTVGMPLVENVAYEHTIAEYIEFRYRPSGFEKYEYFVPVALYQAAVQTLTAIVLFIAGNFKKIKLFCNAGCLFLAGLSLCGIIRFVCGFFYLSVHPGVHSGQIVSLIISLAAMLLLYRKSKVRTYY